MAKILRKFQKIFASGAANNGQFGSAVAGTKITSSDVETLQALAAYLSGWDSATIGSQKLPTLEEFQALHYISNYQLAYLFQEGVSEWNTDTEYHENSMVKDGTVLYLSKTNTNTGNAVSDTANWLRAGDISYLFAIENANADINVGIAGAVATNNLTVTLKQNDGAADPSSDNPLYIPVRDDDKTVGGYSIEKVESALSLVVPNGATLGTVSGEEERLYIYLIKDTTNEIGISKSILDESEIYSSVAIDTSADLDNVLYSTNAKTNKSIALLGHIDITEATAGAWATAPSKIFSGKNGNAIFYGPYNISVTATNWTSSSQRAVFYQVNGKWRMVFNISGTRTVGSTSLVLTVAGVSINPGIQQAFTADIAAAGWAQDKIFSFTSGGTLTINSAATAFTQAVLSGDIELSSKPTSYVP